MEHMELPGFKLFPNRVVRQHADAEPAQHHRLDDAQIGRDIIRQNRAADAEACIQ